VTNRLPARSSVFDWVRDARRDVREIRAGRPRGLPMIYLGSAHLALAVALLVTAIDPRAIAGFFYHHHLIALVHLVTLGWISLTIVALLDLAGPGRRDGTTPVRAIDYAIAALLIVGLIGMAGHFWIDEYGGMAWSAGVVAAGFVLLAIRWLPRLARASGAQPATAPMALALINILAAATMGILLGIDRVHPILSGYVLTNVFAHAHLAAIGWASLMVIGLADQLWPTARPTSALGRRSLNVSAILLEAGGAGLFVSLLKESRWTPLAGALVMAGFGVFLWRAIGMMRQRPAPAHAAQPDYGRLHAAAALIYLAIACVLGLTIAVSPMTDETLRLAAAYGVCGLLGFLAQMLLGLETSLVPRAIGREPHLGLQEAVFWLWVLGVPAVAAGFAADAIPYLAGGAWLLFAATIASGADLLRMLTPRSPLPSSPTADSRSPRAG
jgi:hypothetical protein